MLKISILAFALVGAAAAWAADASTQVIDHHVANMKSGNIDGILSDYAPDAVVVTPAGMANPSGVFVGKDTRKLFSVLAAPKNLPGNKTMQTHYTSLGADTTRMEWVQSKGTPREVSGYDVFVIRGGKIVFQAVIVNPSPKLMKAN
jgi:ketosteroid isomerase-like protein